MIVYKFGGALARSRRGLEALARLVTEAHRAESVRARRSARTDGALPASKRTALHGLVVVVSAIGHTTRHLARAAELAEEGELAEAENTLDRSIGQHEQLAEQLGIEDEIVESFDVIARHVRALLEGIAILRELSPRTRDAILAAGEQFASALVAAFLKDRELPVFSLDAREIIVTDGRNGGAIPIEEATRDRVRNRVIPRLARNEVVLTQGFIGATVEGVTTTMGSESSDLTATLLAGALGAREVVIWKTLPGLFTADPELVPTAKLIRSLSFDEAEELGLRGARILFPSFAHPLLRSDSKTVLRIATPFGKPSGARRNVAGSQRAGRHTLLQRESETSVAAPKTTPIARPQKPLALAAKQKLVLIRLIPSESKLTPSSSVADRRRKTERFESLMSEAFVSWRSPSGERMLVIPKEDRAQFVRNLDRDLYAVLQEQPVSVISLIVRKAKEQPMDSRFVAQMSRSLRAFPAHALLPMSRSILAIIDDAPALAALRKLHRDLIEG